MFKEGNNTYVGLLATAIAMLAKQYGYELSPAFESDFAQLCLLAAQGLGLLYAWYGRARATTPGGLAKLQGH